MKAKKSKKVDLEQYRTTLFLLSLIISLGAILAAFEWKTHPKPYEINGELVVETTELDFPPIVIEEKKTEETEIKEAIKFVLVDDKTEIDFDYEIFGGEIDDGPVNDLSLMYFAPTKKEKEDEFKVFSFVEQMPEFPGGEKALLSYLGKSVKYPVMAQENGVEGRVYVSFVIDIDGSISNVVVARGADLALNTEAIRVVKNMPRWKAGSQGGRKVRVSYTVPINFVLQ